MHTLLAALITSTMIFAHHGWSSYDETKSTRLQGMVQGAQYENPHATIQLLSGGASYVIVLAPVSRLQARGLTEDMLKIGTKVAVIAYPKRDNPNEYRAERITVENKTYELRR